MNRVKPLNGRLDMKQYITKVSLLIAACFFIVSFAGTRDIVLQNGLGEYSGCEETSLSSSDPAGMYGEFANCMLTYEKCAT